MPPQCRLSGSAKSQPESIDATSAPASWATMKAGTWTGVIASGHDRRQLVARRHSRLAIEYPDDPNR